MFSTTMLLLFGCSFFVLKIADKGVKELEVKHTHYTEAFKNQALVTFKIEEIIEKIYRLKKEDRTMNEQKHLQGLISNIRMDIEDKIEDDGTALGEFSLYEQLLVQVSAIQNTIDLFEQDEESYNYSQQLLEKCREKYRDQSLGIIRDEEKEGNE